MPKQHLLKLILLGDSGVGKTSIMTRFVKDEFTLKHRATIGADFLTKTISISDSVTVTVQIW